MTLKSQLISRSAHNFCALCCYVFFELNQQLGMRQSLFMVQWLGLWGSGAVWCGPVRSDAVNSQTVWKRVPISGVWGFRPRWGSLRGALPPWSCGGGAKFDSSNRFVFEVHIEKFSVSDYSRHWHQWEIVKDPFQTGTVPKNVGRLDSGTLYIISPKLM